MAVHQIAKVRQPEDHGLDHDVLEARDACLGDIVSGCSCRAGDAWRVMCKVSRLLLHLAQRVGHGIHPQLEGRIALVCDPVVILDEVDAAAGETRREFCKFVRRQALRLECRTSERTALDTGTVALSRESIMPAAPIAYH